MPVYEYEPDDRECLMCDGRVAVIQALDDLPLKYCPHFGMEVHRVISRVTFKLAGESPPMEAAGKKGFTTYKRAEKGVWERIDGVGPDAIVGSKEDVAAVEAEKKRPRVVDLDGET